LNKEREKMKRKGSNKEEQDEEGVVELKKEKE
jgi:hypothetical protein